MSVSHKNTLPRRSLLTYLASAAGVFGLDTLAGRTAAAAPKPAVPKVPTPDARADANDLSLATLRSNQTKRSSSYDRTGANKDAFTINPGETITLLDATGPGVISHIWFTIQSADGYHLKSHVLRAYWDGEATPSIECPVGDFFGLGLGEYFLYQSAVMNVAPIKALNCYLPMPFRKSARITVTNESPRLTPNFYFNIDFYTVASFADDVAYFHAQYRQQVPTKGVNEPLNLTGKNNYVFLEATGRGHLIGIFQAVLQNQDGWMGEGDEMIFIDDADKIAIQGTGTEDYYNGGWNFGARTGAVQFSYPYIGAPLIQNPEVAGGRVVMYRWHIDNPVRFEKSIRMTIEHGSSNNRSDNYYTVAYWYQTEPHAAFPALPAWESRVPHLYVSPGPNATPIPAPPVSPNTAPTKDTVPVANPSSTTMAPATPH